MITTLLLVLLSSSVSRFNDLTNGVILVSFSGTFQFNTDVFEMDGIFCFVQDGEGQAHRLQLPSILLRTVLETIPLHQAMTFSWHDSLEK